MMEPTALGDGRIHREGATAARPSATEGAWSVLYAGDLQPATTSLARYQALQQLGLELRGFDTHQVCKHSSRLLNILGHRLYCTPGVIAGNQRILELAAKMRPRVVWIDKGRWIYPSTLRRLRKLGARLVHYNTDDIYGGERVLWLHRLGLKHYDIALTTNRFNVSEIADKFGVKVCRAGMGYDAAIHTPPADVGKEKEDVVFVGHHEPHTEEYVLRLRAAGFNIAVHGHEWQRAKDASLRTTKPLPQVDYNYTLASARLALCVLSRRNRNESTGRSFEIPAVGGCLLAEDTPEHRFFYRDGIEAILFANPDELVAKCHDWLTRPRELKLIALAGQQRCLSLGLTWVDHVKREWGICQRALESGGLHLSEKDDEPMWTKFRSGESAQSLTQ